MKDLSRFNIIPTPKYCTMMWGYNSNLKRLIDQYTYFATFDDVLAYFHYLVDIDLSKQGVSRETHNIYQDEDYTFYNVDGVVNDDGDDDTIATTWSDDTHCLLYRYTDCCDSIEQRIVYIKDTALVYDGEWKRPHGICVGLSDNLKYTDSFNRSSTIY